jgi:hypothetical protein
MHDDYTGGRGDTQAAVDPPVFIVGFPRSGTTLLRAMLDSHPDLAIPPESHFIPLLWSVRRRYESPSGFDADGLVSDILNARRFREWGLPRDAVIRQVEALRRPSFESVVEAVFMAYAEVRGKHRWGDKTPGYSLEIPLISKLWPESRFIHVIRDGRDVALSFLDVFRRNAGLPMVAEAWARRTRKARSDGRSLGSNRYFEMHYEYIVSDTEAALRDVCKAINLDFRPQMLRYYERAGGSIPSREKRLHKNVLKPPTSGLRDWRSQMDPRSASIFEAIAGNELTAFGYERAHPEPSAVIRVRAGAGRIAVAASAAGRGIRRRALRIAHPAALPIPRRW